MPNKSIKFVLHFPHFSRHASITPGLTPKRDPETFMNEASKAMIIWLSILALAIANGLFREAVLLPAFGIPAAFVLSGLLLSALIIGVAWVSLPWLRLRRPGQFWLVGLGWLALTLAFEFSFGLAQGKSWPVMLEAYTFKDGNLWPVILAVTACAPFIAAKMRRKA